MFQTNKYIVLFTLLVNFAFVIRIYCHHVNDLYRNFIFSFKLLLLLLSKLLQMTKIKVN